MLFAPVMACLVLSNLAGQRGWNISSRPYHPSHAKNNHIGAFKAKSSAWGFSFLSEWPAALLNISLKNSIIHPGIAHFYLSHTIPRASSIRFFSSNILLVHWVKLFTFLALSRTKNRSSRNTKLFRISHGSKKMLNLMKNRICHTMFVSIKMSLGFFRFEAFKVQWEVKKQKFILLFPV